MHKEKLQLIRDGFETAYINGSNVSELQYTPGFVSNNHNEGKKVLTAIEDELLKCDKFQISVAFITLGGVTPLLQTLKELEARGIPGEILTTNYLDFSEPKALEKLNTLRNIQIKMYDINSANNGFHTKGYIFKEEETYRIIIGSSNMTSAALTTNREWNTKLISTSQGKVAEDILKEFNELWHSPYALDYKEFYEEYKQRYDIIKAQRKIAIAGTVTSLEQYKLKPNTMQVRFINNLKRILQKDEKRALLISATGTGKTYASAFAMRELGFKRVLFLVHRGQLAKQTKKSYEKVFGKSVSMGLVGAGYNQYDKDYIFATVQTLNRDSHLFQYEPEDFDCIILDEAHHSSANTYKKVMEYFNPRLFLGMTATPDKRDDNEEGKNVYEIFNYQIAHEIRLQQAMEDDLLCPFHYFGVSELSAINDDNLDGKKLNEKDFNALTSDERVRHIIDQAEYFGYSGDRVKGLIFCSRIDESVELSRKFNEKGFRTIALNGNASEAERAKAFERLAMDEEDADGEMEPLDYIFSVEILNEGVDIVEVNQVIMLRPTQSPIVFIQQLGRGLRKAEGKEYVIVLDFIGNYKNNFMIPIALSGDRTYNKDNVRKYIMEGGRVIPGASSIHFDQVARKRIFESIDKDMKTSKAFLKEKYLDLRNRLGRIPTIVDFYDHGEIDPMLFIAYSGTYDKFVRMVDEDYKIKFTTEQEQFLEYISNVIVNGKRVHELLIMRELLINGECNPAIFENKMHSMDEKYDKKDYVSACNVINKEFINSASEKKKYKTVEFVDTTRKSKESLERSQMFAKAIEDMYFRREIENLILYGFKRYSQMYRNHDENNLVLYQKYSRKDVCRILNWEKDDSSTVYGYRIKHGTCPIFVTYEKDEDIAESTKYKDEFELLNDRADVRSNKIFSWMTRSRVSLESEEAQKLIKAKETKLKILLFLKKSNGEGTDFYYMGEATPIHWEQTVIKNDKGQELPIMNFKLELEHEVRQDIFDYFTA